MQAELTVGRGREFKCSSTGSLRPSAGPRPGKRIKGILEASGHLSEVFTCASPTKRQYIPLCRLFLFILFSLEPINWPLLCPVLYEEREDGVYVVASVHEGHKRTCSVTYKRPGIPRGWGTNNVQLYKTITSNSNTLCWANVTFQICTLQICSEFSHLPRSVMSSLASNKL